MKGKVKDEKQNTVLQETGNKVDGQNEKRKRNRRQRGEEKCCFNLAKIY